MRKNGLDPDKIYNSLKSGGNVLNTDQIDPHTLTHTQIAFGERPPSWIFEVIAIPSESIVRKASSIFYTKHFKTKVLDFYQKNRAQNL